MALSFVYTASYRKQQNGFDILHIYIFDYFTKICIIGMEINELILRIQDKLCTLLSYTMI